MRALKRTSLFRTARYSYSVLGTFAWQLLRPRTAREISEFHSTKVMDAIQTLDALGGNRTSFARFGDGEFNYLLDSSYEQSFQDNSPELVAELKKILTVPQADLLIGIPKLQRNRWFWREYWVRRWPKLGALLKAQPYFGDASLTRPDVFQEFGDSVVDKWRTIWDDREVVVVTGEGSKFSLVPELFSSAKDISFLYSKPTNAFSDIDRVFTEIFEMKPDLVLISLGPAGTVLTARLAPHIQTIDIGHISNSYSTVFSGAVAPELQ